MTARWQGVLAGALVVLIWAGWFTLSRYGARSSLTTYDITALRFGCACLVTSPLWWSYAWRRVRWGRALVVALGCGFPYTLLVFHGLRSAGAAEGGVWVNGAACRRSLRCCPWCGCASGQRATSGSPVWSCSSATFDSAALVHHALGRRVAASVIAAAPTP